MASPFDPQSIYKGIKAGKNILSEIRNTAQQPNFKQGILEKVRAETKPPVPTSVMPAFDLPRVPLGAPRPPALDVTKLAEQAKLVKTKKETEKNKSASITRVITRIGEGISNLLNQTTPVKLAQAAGEHVRGNIEELPQMKEQLANTRFKYEDAPLTKGFTEHLATLDQKASEFKEDPSVGRGLGIGLGIAETAFIPMAVAFQQLEKAPVVGPSLKSILGTAEQGVTNWTDYAFKPTKGEGKFTSDLKQNFLKPLTNDVLYYLLFKGAEQGVSGVKALATTKKVPVTKSEFVQTLEEYTGKRDVSGTIPKDKAQAIIAKVQELNDFLKTNDPLATQLKTGKAKLVSEVTVPRDPIGAIKNLFKKMNVPAPSAFVEKLIRSAHPDDLVKVTNHLVDQYKNAVSRGIGGRETIGFRPLSEETGMGKMTSLKGFQDVARPGITEPLPDTTPTTRILDELKGRTDVSRQFIEDLTNKPEIKQAEREVIRRTLEEFEGQKINVPEFENKVRTSLLPLEANFPAMRADTVRFENITLPDELRGRVQNYDEFIYESPIKTSAGDVHFSSANYPGYFAHVRTENIPGDIRRVIEVQSDLFQKGRLENDFGRGELQAGQGRMVRPGRTELEPYRNTWYERIIREEVRRAAEDGKGAVLFPTGETAMKVEGLGQVHNPWRHAPSGKTYVEIPYEEMRVGQTIRNTNQWDDWIITEVLGDGKFKAVPKRYIDLQLKNWTIKEDIAPDGAKVWFARNDLTGANTSVEYVESTKEKALKYLKEERIGKDKNMQELQKDYGEEFDISGKVDTNNPIYRFYEKDVAKYLKREYGENMTRITDPQGVEWYKVDLNRKLREDVTSRPVFAFKKTPQEGIPERARVKADLSKEKPEKLKMTEPEPTGISIETLEDIRKQIKNYEMSPEEAIETAELLEETGETHPIINELKEYSDQVNSELKRVIKEEEKRAGIEAEYIEKAGGLIMSGREIAEKVGTILRKNRFVFTKTGQNLELWIDRNMATQDWPTFIKNFTKLIESSLGKGQKWPKRPEVKNFLDLMKGGMIDNADSMSQVLESLPEFLKKPANEIRRRKTEGTPAVSPGSALPVETVEKGTRKNDRENQADSLLAKTDRQILGAPGEAGKTPLEPMAEVEGKAKEEPPIEGKPLEAKQSISDRLNKDVESSLGNIPEKEKVSIGRAAAQMKEEPSTVKRMVDSVKKITTDLVEYVQNTDLRVKKLMEKEGMKVEDISNPYQKATLYPGRVADKVKEAYDKSEEIIFDSKKLADELGTDLATVRKEVNDYLLFEHAPERNKAIGEGAAGITTEEANQGLKEMQSRPEFSKIVELAERAHEINEKTLDVLLEGGVITEKLYDTLRTRYQKHVPLQRIFEETEDIGGALSGRGFDVKSTGIQRAVGSQREVNDILGNIVSNYEQAILRAEKNIVDQATLAFVRENKENLGDLFTITAPKPIGKDFEGNILTEKTNDPTVLQLFENGKKVWIKIKDPHLAIALRGVGRENIGTLLQIVASFTRMYSGLATRFNPEFALPNKIRDLQETMVYMASQKDVKTKKALGVLKQDPASVKAVTDALRGKDTPGAKLYNEMKAMGGTTGGLGLSTREQVQISIEKMEKLANSKTHRIAERLVEYVDNWNTIFEDSTRLSVYKKALESGLTKERAAFLAKESSINFNRMGRGGPLINSLWMFSNASIQGTAKMVSSLKNPKVLLAVTLVVATVVAASGEWNDEIDPEWRDKVSKWDRLNGVPVVLPSFDEDFHYITIPVSWGLKPIKVMSDYAYDSMNGQDFEAKEFANDLGTAIIEAANPLGGTDLMSAVTPTIGDVPLEISRNKSWSGFKIRPDSDPNAPEDIKYFQSLAETKTGQAAISISELLQEKFGIAISPANIKYAYDSYIGGAGRTTSKTINLITGGIEGEFPPLDEYPMVSRFYRKRTPEEIGAGAAGQTEVIKETLSEQSRARFEVKKEARKLFDELKGLPKEEANARVNEIKKDNPELYNQIKDLREEEKLGLNFTEKLMKQLGVENGERAKYIWDTLEKLETPEEKNAYIKELTDKKIISKEVKDQLRKLKAEAPKESKAFPGYKNQEDYVKNRKFTELLGDYKDAYLTDPGNAWKAMFGKEKLEVVKGDLVELQRFYGIEFDAKGGSQEYKRKLMEEKGIPWSDADKYNLEHILPRAAGGGNEEDNRLLADRATHNLWTPVDILLGKAVEEGKIKRKEAERLARALKVDKTMTIEEVIKELE